MTDSFEQLPLEGIRARRLTLDNDDGRKLFPFSKGSRILYLRHDAEEYVNRYTYLYDKWQGNDRAIFNNLKIIMKKHNIKLLELSHASNLSTQSISKTRNNIVSFDTCFCVFIGLCLLVGDQNIEAPENIIRHPSSALPIETEIDKSTQKSEIVIAKFEWINNKVHLKGNDKSDNSKINQKRIDIAEAQQFACEELISDLQFSNVDKLLRDYPIEAGRTSGHHALEHRDKPHTSFHG